MVEKNPVYHSCVLLVNDIRKSKHFYNTILGQEIEMDFGRNVVFKGGFSIWKKDYAFNLIFQEKAIDTPVEGNNFEVYFETEDIYDLYQRLVKKVKVIHSIIEHPWGQRAFRVWDPDDHIVEFAETMESVVKSLNIKVWVLKKSLKNP
jgi:catechol 2,3-dioxygenase-like lactoylglutathione lyase family enzyme